MSLITAEMRAAASEMYQGDEICREKSQWLLTEMGLPNGLLPLKDIEEVGYVKETGFVWLIQKKKCEHRFEKIGKPVQYAAEVTAYVEPNRIYKLTGVKAKELLLWVMLKEITADPSTGKITFKTPTGLFRTFPVDAFHLEEDNQDIIKPKVKDDPIKPAVDVDVEAKPEVKPDAVGVAAPAPLVELKEV